MSTVLHTRNDEIGDWAIEQYRRWRQEVLIRGTMPGAPASATEESEEPEGSGST